MGGSGFSNCIIQTASKVSVQDNVEHKEVLCLPLHSGTQLCMKRILLKSGMFAAEVQDFTVT